MQRHREKAGDLGEALDHFLKVTRSYWSGLFHCYEMADLPRTNNQLEQFFGSHRYHERRASGRRAASPSLVLRGSVRVIAAAATRVQSFDAGDLVPRDLRAWHELRQNLERRRAARSSRTRFRRDPETYLRELEETFTRQALPA